VAPSPLHGLPVEVAASGAGEVEAATALHGRASGEAGTERAANRASWLAALRRIRSRGRDRDVSLLLADSSSALSASRASERCSFPRFCVSLSTAWLPPWINNVTQPRP
jgi:hypothetical protein